MREAVAASGGHEVDTRGDELFAAFPTAAAAAQAAVAVQRSHAEHPWAGEPVRVRIGLHTGSPLITEDGYVGIDVHRASRISDAGHGGQILLSER
ncbi:MAG: ATPase, partial [Gaiellaceae bacterium]|nr:ATPase [Gaiellaceae bacterium]